MPAIPPRDRDILRRLAGEQAAITQLPVHREKALLWRRLNDLEPVRPMVWINEICWNEINVDDELTLACEHQWARQQEEGLRRLLYQWHHLPADMIVDDYLTCPLVIQSTGFGIVPIQEIIRSDVTSEVVSHRFFPQFQTEKDIDKIKRPVIYCDWEATEQNYQTMCEIYAGILPVRKVGIKGAWFSPWDRLVEVWGVERALTDLVDRPELLNAAVERLVEAHLSMLDQWEELNLLARNDDNTRIGSGGYGYTSQLPGPGYDPAHPRTADLWGCATAQIFADISPKMHWEFALRHEIRWLERWGLTYYGCCEPLDRKTEILRRVPNLRKISVSPWNNLERMINALGHKYVLSRKPNPAILARDSWQPEVARQELCDFLDRARGLSVELILKDISTVRYDPRRLWEWASLAMQIAEEYAP